MSYNLKKIEIMGFINKINNGTELYCGLVMVRKFIDNGYSRGYATYNLECFAFENKDDYLKKNAECFREKKEFVNITDSKLFYELTNRYPNFEGNYKIAKRSENSTLEYLKSQN